MYIKTLYNIANLFSTVLQCAPTNSTWEICFIMPKGFFTKRIHLCNQYLSAYYVPGWARASIINNTEIVFAFPGFVFWETYFN